MARDTFEKEKNGRARLRNREGGEEGEVLIRFWGRDINKFHEHKAKPRGGGGKPRV